MHLDAKISALLILCVIIVIEWMVKFVVVCLSNCLQLIKTSIHDDHSLLVRRHLHKKHSINISQSFCIVCHLQIFKLKFICFKNRKQMKREILSRHYHVTIILYRICCACTLIMRMKAVVVEFSRYCIVFPRERRKFQLNFFSSSFASGREFVGVNIRFCMIALWSFPTQEKHIESFK